MVYRPPKHKAAPGARPAISPSADPLSSQPGDGAAALSGDDRNLVNVNEGYASASFEDSLWLFWQNHKNKVLGAVVLACVILLGLQGWKFYQQNRISALQTEYQAVKGADGLLAFGQAHPDEMLGKLAVLEAADTLYNDGKFKDAADAYDKAATALGSADIKAQRARLGQALALFKSGDAAGAEKQLETLYNDSSVLANFRAEACFFNAAMYAQNGDGKNAATWIDRVKDFKSTQMWPDMATALGEMLPLMANLKLAPGSLSEMPKDKASVNTESLLAPSPPAASAAAASAPAKSTVINFLPDKATGN